MIEIETCPVCGSPGLRGLKQHTFRKPPARSSGGGGAGADRVRDCLEIFFDRVAPGCDSVAFSVDLCLSCGFIFSNPRFTAEEIEEKYRAITESGTGAVRVQPREIFERSRRIERLLSPYRRGEEKSRVLDYGGAEGYNLLAFRHRDTCFVVDMVERGLPPGVGYLGKDLSDLDPGWRFDLILLCHVLEHVPEPTELIRGLASFLAEGGLLYIEVPLGVASEWRRIREPLTHVNYFSEQSLARCAGEPGLSIVWVSTDYQVVTGQKSWCINLVCRKEGSGGLGSARVRSTRRQAMTPRYYVPAVYRNLKRRIEGLRPS